VLCRTKGVGIRAYRMPSYPTTTAIMKVWWWHHPRCYMVVVTEPRCFGIRLESERLLYPTYKMMPRDKFVWRERTWGLHNQSRRVMPDINEKNWAMKLEIMWTPRYHQWEVYDISRFKANSHIGSLVHSRSWKRKKKNRRQNFQISFLIHPNLEGKIHF
jgi:hypothetical protein